MIIWTGAYNVRGPGRTTNIGGGKAVQNSARFRTTLDFDREYLRNIKLGRADDQLHVYNPSHVGQKKIN